MKKIKQQKSDFDREMEDHEYAMDGQEASESFMFQGEFETDDDDDDWVD